MSVNSGHGRVLMVAYYFPPLAAAGSHRTMNFSRELERIGWDVTVISSSERKRFTVDEGLMSRVGPNIRIKRAPSPDIVRLLGDWKSNLRKRPDTPGPGREEGTPEPRQGFFDYISRLLKTPDSMLSFVPFVLLKAGFEMMSHRPDVLYSSAPPYSCHLAAYCLKNLFRVPWIADFRDPWADNPFRNDNPYRTLRALDLRLEERVVKEADAVVLNTPALEQSFRRRYPNLDHFATISNGFDPELFEDVVRLDAGSEKKSGAELEIVHMGEVYGLRSPRHLINAVADLSRERPEGCAHLKFAFFGCVHDRDGLSDQIRDLGLESLFSFEGQVDHDEALKRCARADILLLLGVMGSRPEVQVPSKLFEYLALKKPILSLSKRGGAIHSLLKESMVPFLLADLEKEEEIKGALERMLANDFEGGEGWGGVKAFAFDHLSRRLARLMEDLTSGRAPSL